jgi:hypothetical protein
MNKYNILIKFNPNKLGELYELQYIKLTTKRISKERALELAEIEAKKTRWTDYQIELSVK